MECRFTSTIVRIDPVYEEGEFSVIKLKLKKMKGKKFPNLLVKEEKHERFSALVAQEYHVTR